MTSYEGKILTGIEAYDLSHVKGQMGADLAVGILFEADFLNNNTCIICQMFHFLRMVNF